MYLKKSKAKSFNVGDRFGNWIVVDPTCEKRMIVCHCEKCGNTKKVNYVNLIRGTSTNCGCDSKIEKINVGDLFGYWKVLEKLGGRKLRCQCIGCNFTILDKDYVALLKSGGKRSCGCAESKDGLPGRLKERIKPGVVFGNWLVEEPLQGRLVGCKCLGCGMKHMVEYVGLVKGSSKSCGCKKMENIVATNLEKYGVAYTCNIPEIREKQKQTNLERYGNENVGRIPEFREKRKKTLIETYGVEYFSQLPENRNKLKEWCEENPERLFASKSEQEILDWVREFYPSARKHKENGHEIDIFIPEINIGIEYNGLYWHSELGMERRGHNPKNYHLEKTLYYKSKGIKIIHIWEHLWRDKKGQVKSFLRSALKLNQNKIAARKCKVIFSNDKEEIKKSHDLLEKTHIQGKPHATKFVANVYYEDNLLATASFALHHRTSKDLVLTRFTTKENYTIQGILSKISNLASNNLKSKIISWADFAISDGNGYQKAGWQMEEKLPVDYFYCNPKTGKVVSKQSRQKKYVGTPKEMTELEHALLDGLVRVWDCGKIRFGFKKNDY